MLKKIVFYILALALVTSSGGLFLTPQKAEAITYDSATYRNGGYYHNLISDEEFTDIDSMTVGDIQNFLVANNSYLQYYNENGRYAAQIIWDAAHGRTADSRGTLAGIGVDQNTGTVNPMVILVTLQKEQSLITNPNRNESGLTWAMGYGCLENGSRNPALAGFSKQVDWGAWQLRYNFHRADPARTDLPNYKVGQTMNFSDWTGTYSVTFANRATASLYRYTPHVYNGNYNFWRIFHDNTQLTASRFNLLTTVADPLAGDTVASTLSLVNDGSGNVYALTGSGASERKWGFKDDTVLSEWGIDKTGLIISDLSGVSDAELLAGRKINRLVNLDGQNAIYLIENGNRRFLETRNSLGSYGLTSADLVSLPLDFLRLLGKGENMSQLVKNSSGTLFYISPGSVLYQLTDSTIARGMGFQVESADLLDRNSLAVFTQGAILSQVIKNDSPTIYLMVNGYKRAFTSWDDLVRGGYGSSVVTLSSDEILNMFQTGSNVSFPAYLQPPAPAPVVATPAPAPAPQVKAAETVKYKTVTKCSYQTKVVKGKKKKVKVCSKVRVPMKKVVTYKYQNKTTCSIKKVKGKNKKVCKTTKVKVPVIKWI